jgi:hypothetical protein
MDLGNSAFISAARVDDVTSFHAIKFGNEKGTRCLDTFSVTPFR